jgi:hypothetical protein
MAASIMDGAHPRDAGVVNDAESSRIERPGMRLQPSSSGADADGSRSRPPDITFVPHQPNKFTLRRPHLPAWCVRTTAYASQRRGRFAREGRL